MSTDLTRRSLLAGLVALAGGGAWYLRRSARESRLELVRELAASHGLDAATGLGRAYLEAYPEEADSGRLLGALFADGGSADVAELAGRLGERIERDWVALDTVQLDGWIVSRTEGRLLALIELAS